MILHAFMMTNFENVASCIHVLEDVYKKVLNGVSRSSVCWKVEGRRPVLEVPRGSCVTLVSRRRTPADTAPAAADV